LCFFLVKMAKNWVMKTHSGIIFRLVMCDVQCLKCTMRMAHQKDRDFIILFKHFLMEAEGVLDQLFVAFMKSRLTLTSTMSSLIHSKEIVAVFDKFLGQKGISACVILLTVNEKYNTFRRLSRRIPVSLNLYLLISFHHMKVV
jgi:hypothetical protein